MVRSVHFKILNFEIDSSNPMLLKHDQAFLTSTFFPSKTVTFHPNINKTTLFHYLSKAIDQRYRVIYSSTFF